MNRSRLFLRVILFSICLLGGFGLLIGCGGSNGDDSSASGGSPTGSVQASQITGKVTVFGAKLASMLPIDDSLASGSETANGLRAAVNSSVSGARVYLEENPSLAAVTDKNGAYAIPNVPVGQYHVIAVITASSGKVYKNRSPLVTLSNIGQEVFPAELILEVASNRIRGVVNDASGTPLVGAQMSLWGETFYSGQGGVFETPLMPQGSTGELQVLSSAGVVTQSLDFSAPRPPTLELTVGKAGSPNRGPIVSVIADRYDVSAGGYIKLEGTALDPDGDTVSTTWAADRGVITASVVSSAKAVWTAPSEIGIATVTFEATDSKGQVGRMSVSLTIGGGTLDTTAPTILSRTPAAAATGVSLFTPFTVVFSKDLDPFTVTQNSLRIFESSGNSLSGEVNYADRNLQFLVKTPLKPGTTYSVQVDPGLRDRSGNAFGGEGWSFVTQGAADVTRPTLLSSIPAAGAADVPINAAVSLTFSESLAPSSVNEAILQVQSATGIPVKVSLSHSRNQVLLAPVAHLEGGRTYRVSIASGVTDEVGNSLGAPQSFTFTTTSVNDTVPPRVLSVNPRENASRVAIATPVTIRFSEMMTSAGILSGNIELLDSLGSPVSSTITTDGMTATLTSVAALAAGKTYTCMVHTGLTDLAGNSLASAKTWSFTTDDTAAFAVTSLSPANAATGVVASGNLTITFNRNVGKGSGNISIFQASTGSLFETLSVSDSRISIDGTRAIIDPVRSFDSEVTYYVQISNTCFLDANGLAYPGISDTVSWRFTSGATDGPLVMALFPRNGQTGMASSSVLEMIFSKNVQKGTSGEIVIRRYADNSVFEQIPIADGRITVNGNLVTIDPAGTFAISTAYYVTVAASSFLDNSSTPYPGLLNTGWLFTTGDAGVPVVTAYYPKANQAGVELNANLEILFSKELTKSPSGEIVIRRLADNSLFEQVPVSDARVSVTGNKVTIDPAGTFTNQTGYYVTIMPGSFHDNSLNAYAGLTSTAWYFTTGDAGAPVVTAFSPKANQTGVGLNTNLEILFSKELTKSPSGGIVIRRLSDNTVFEQIAISDARITVAGSNVSIDPAGTFANQTGYYVTIMPGSFYDNSLNAYAGLNTNAWYFTTGDSGAPGVTAYYPRNGQSGIDVTTNLEVLFNKDLVKNQSGEIVIRRLSDNAVFETIPIADARITVTGSKVTIDPAGTFSDQTGYYVNMTPGCLSDNSNNGFAGLMTTGWSFTTGDSGGPVATVFYPRTGATGVATGTNLEILFSKNVVKGATGEIVIRKVSDHTVFEQIPVSDARVTVSGNRAIINPTANLAYQTAYFMTVSPGAFYDNSLNAYGGITLTTAAAGWTFTTGDPYFLLTRWGVTGTATGTFTNPRGISVSSNGKVFVTDDVHRVQVFSPSGSYWTKWPTTPAASTTAGMFNFPQGIFANAAGDVFVADLLNHRIQKFDQVGALVWQSGTQGTANGQFSFPRGIAEDSVGNLYVADTDNDRIQILTAAGAYSGQWGSRGTGDGQFRAPTDIVIDASDNVYVVDSENNRIQKFDTAGTFLTKWGGFGTQDGQFNAPRGIAVGPTGNVYVTDLYNNRIQVFTSAGALLYKWGGTGVFNAPSSVAIDASGVAFVVDAGNRVQKFQLE